MVNKKTLLYNFSNGQLIYKSKVNDYNDRMIESQEMLKQLKKKIDNEDIIQNEYSLEVVDVFLKVGELM